MSNPHSPVIQTVKLATRCTYDLRVIHWCDGEGRWVEYKGKSSPCPVKGCEHMLRKRRMWVCRKHGCTYVQQPVEGDRCEYDYKGRRRR